MEEKQLLIDQISMLQANGSIGSAYNVAQQAVSKIPGDIELITLLHMMRMEIFAQQQLDAMKHITQQLIRTSNSTSQLLLEELLKNPKFDDPLRLERYGYCAASQNEEDGLLAEVFNRIGVEHKTFFEFGVGSGLQNCTLHFLLQGWRGWWIEINKPKVNFMRKYFADAIASGQLTLDDTNIDAENINSICETLNIDAEIDLLSIDIDGNDYHVFRALEAVKPRVVVLEYNPIFPPPIEMIGAYDANYVHAEDTYIGASLQSLTNLCGKKGFTLVGCSVGGVNAVFVRSDLAEGKFASPSTASNFYHKGRYQLSFSGGFGVGGRANFGKIEKT